MTKRKGLSLILAIVLLTALCAGCGESSDGTNYLDPQNLGFSVPGQASISDFDWYFKPKTYDKSGEALLTDPYDVAGVWEYVNWHKPDTKSSAVKDVYWMYIQVERKAGSLGSADISPEDAADIYAYQGFLNSEEAAAAGLATTTTASQLMEALTDLDPGTACKVVIVHAGREDADGNWSAISNEKPVEFEGDYYPDYLFLKVQDEKKNRITINNFVSNNGEQHAYVSYETGNQKYILNGTGCLDRQK